MKRIGLAVTTAVILATTVPAVAQSYDYDGRGWWGGGRHHQYYRYRPYRHSYGYVPTGIPMAIPIDATTARGGAAAATSLERNA